MGAGFAQMILDSENAGKHLMMAVIDAAQTSVMAYAAAGAAASAAANAGIPGIGWIMAIAGSTAMFGLIKGLLSQIPEYQTGGVVPGVPTGRDTVLAAVSPQERIFSVEQNERMVAALEGGGVGGALHLHQHSVIPSNRMQVTRQYRQLKRHELRLQRLGMA